jgi:iron complex transport system substrate-binding protein
MNAANTSGDMYLWYVSPKNKERGHVPKVHVPARAPSPTSPPTWGRVPLLVLVVTALMLMAAAPSPLGAQSGPQDLKDDLGRPFPLPERTPDRIVSMAPNITEILFALGLGDRVAGVTRFCDYPPEARSIRRIGGLVDPNIEVIQSLDPGLVIAFRGNPLRLVDRIRKLGLPVFVLDIGQGLEALFPLIAKIGRVTRSEERAAALAAGLRQRLEAVDAAMSRVRARPKVFVLLYGQGLWTCGGESYVDDLIRRAGGTNVASSMPKKWVLYKREQILEDDADVIFILARSREDFATGRDWLQKKAHVESVAAVRSGRIFELDENAASRFGPRLVDVLDRMARLLHPELFGEWP